MHCKKLHKIGETKVFGVLNKIKTVLKVFVIGAISLTSSAYANEITAIDFNGDVIGKVIPDGSVIGMQNNVIGKITADSFIVNNKGDIIGGIVPQGVAIGNDNRLLGKVNNDGTVRLPTGKIIAKVLPNALVVDDSYNVLGSVLYPGLIYDDEGKTVGRLTGDGLYISMEGQNIGFVSPLGYAYRNNGTGYTLDGRLISSKMVVSSDGKFIGSISPGGKVTDFDTKIIGSVHANGYVYNENYQVIGKTVTNGYAFDNIGNYLGVVSYNGEVIKSGKITGKLRADDKIINEEGEVIGFNVEIVDNPITMETSDAGAEGYIHHGSGWALIEVNSEVKLQWTYSNKLRAHLKDGYSKSGTYVDSLIINVSDLHQKRELMNAKHETIEKMQNQERKTQKGKSTCHRPGQKEGRSYYGLSSLCETGVRFP